MQQQLGLYFIFLYIIEHNHNLALTDCLQIAELQSQWFATVHNNDVFEIITESVPRSNKNRQHQSKDPMSDLRDCGFISLVNLLPGTQSSQCAKAALQSAEFRTNEINCSQSKRRRLTVVLTILFCFKRFQLRFLCFKNVDK